MEHEDVKGPRPRYYQYIHLVKFIWFSSHGGGAASNNNNYICKSFNFVFHILLLLFFFLNVIANALEYVSCYGRVEMQMLLRKSYTLKD